MTELEFNQHIQCKGVFTRSFQNGIITELRLIGVTRESEEYLLSHGYKKTFVGNNISTFTLK